MQYKTLEIWQFCNMFDVFIQEEQDERRTNGWLLPLYQPTCFVSTIWLEFGIFFRYVVNV